MDRKVVRRTGSQAIGRVEISVRLAGTAYTGAMQATRPTSPNSRQPGSCGCYRRPIVCFVVLMTVLLMTSCATLRTDDRVRVTVSNIEVIEATLLEQLYLVTLRIQNRGDTPLAISGASFDLDINGRGFGSGVSDQQVEVAPFSDSKLEVRMVSTVFGMLRLINGMQNRDGEPVSYSISGRFSTGQGFGSVGFRESGEIELPGRDKNPSGEIL